MKRTLLVLGVIIHLVAAFAAEIEYDASRDTEISEAAPDENYGTSLRISVWGGTGTPVVPDEIGMIVFAGLDELAGAKIDSATLRLYVIGLVSQGQVKVFRIAGDWVETAVTWNLRPDSNLSITTTENVPDHSNTWFETDVTDMVRSWVEDGFPNHGFYISAPPQGPDVQVGVQFASRENTLNHPPKLRVTYHTAAIVEDALIKRFEMLPLTSGETRLSFTLAEAADVSLNIYDVLGSLVETLIMGKTPPGDHDFIWRSSSGIYFIRLETPSQTVTRKAVVIY